MDVADMVASAWSLGSEDAELVSAVRSGSQEAIDKAMAQLPEAYRTAVVLRDLEDFSYEEIADVLQVSLGTVKSRVARGRSALKIRLAGLLQPAKAFAAMVG